MSNETTKGLEEEGEVAADYLEELLDIVEFDGDIDIDVAHDRASVDVFSETEADKTLLRLVGKDGEVIDALQELVRLAVQTKIGERSRLMLDIAGYRSNLRKELTRQAELAVAKVRETGEAVRLRAMNSFERKVVHDVAGAAELVSESEGIEPNRHVVIRLP